jgi:hypothetical protein
MKHNGYVAPNWAHELPARQQDKVKEWYHAGFNAHDYDSFEAMTEAVIAWIDYNNPKGDYTNDYAI